ncbi:metal ABC transporter permease [Raineya orbicola]|jgi:manganese/zinc/iron transport system permease protein|uniref:ABC-type Mn2+/Zn2+ transport system permease component n=1 Tax=Raineya orbicola TaxID=2016530 RepID=A0A2N3I985_9BACT|nr:metal ABC transporter permease [Raineya orbicola]PKQ66891.1 ABC-type Mn2+/Zn2+ transport system permease component [Raineya orbicola]
MQDIWILVVVSLFALSSSALGSFLVVRQMVMLTDTLSHSILPGIAIAYIVQGEKNNLFILIFALLCGLLIVSIINWLNSRIRNRNDAVLGSVYTFFFAVGIILVTLFGEQADLDTDCVLFGEMLYIPFDTLDWAEMPRNFPLALVVGIGVLFFVWKSFRPLSIISFDETFAQSIGVNVTFWNYALTSLVTIVTILSFEIVGSVMVVAMFAFPPAIAFLLTKRLQIMLIISLIVSIFSVVIGYYFSVWQGGSSAASIVIVQGIFFMLSVIFNKVGFINKIKI